MIELPFKLKKIIIVIILSSFLLLFFLVLEIPDDKLHVWFLNIGQGDSIFIKTPNNNQILIDGGPENAILEELNAVIPFFDKSIDLLILSHPHADHIDGLVEVLKKYQVKAVMFSGVNYENAMYDEFIQEVDKQNIDFFISDELLDFQFDEVFFDTLYPFDQILFSDFKNLNNSSIVLKMIYKDTSILFTGDMEEDIEIELIKHHVNLKSDILKVGHHGSKTSSSMDFLLKVRPDIAVIQAGIDNKFDHPHYKTLINLSAVDVNQIYRTDLDGRIEFVFD